MKNIGKVAVLSTSLLIGSYSTCTTIPHLFKSIDHAEAASLVKFSKTSYQTTANLRLRTSPSTKSKTVLTIPKGKTVTSSQKQGSWYKVSYTYKSKGKNITKSGWVSGDYIKEYNVYTKTLGTYYSTKKTAKLYAAPNTKKAMVTVPSKTVLYSTQRVLNSNSQTWYRVSYKNKYYYVYGSDVSKTTKPNDTPAETPKEEKTHLVTANLNLRESPEGTSVLITIPKGTTVKSSEILNGDWYKVTYRGKTGYVYYQYLKQYDLTDYRFIDLRTKSTVTAQQINAYIAANYKRYGSKSVLLNKGQAFINAGNTYGVNALYLAAHAIHESAFGTSNISIGKNNLFGYGAYDATPFVGAYRFSSVEQCINYVAQKMKADYLNPNGTHFEGAMLGYKTKDSKGKTIASKSIGMNYWYASDENWGNKIAAHMQKIIAFNKKTYENPKINTNYPSIPAIPSGSDKFPTGIQAIAKKDLSSTIKKGKIFTLLEKTNNFQVKVDYNQKTYTLSNISFSSYKNYISVYNLGRVVNASSLNIRSTPSTTGEDIGDFKLNQYVSLALDKEHKLIEDATKKWYKVNMSNGKTGWVSKSYIKRELP